MRERRFRVIFKEGKYHTEIEISEPFLKFFKKWHWKPIRNLCRTNGNIWDTKEEAIDFLKAQKAYYKIIDQEPKVVWTSDETKLDKL